MESPSINYSKYLENVKCSVFNIKMIGMFLLCLLLCLCITLLSIPIPSELMGACGCKKNGGCDKCRALVEYAEGFESIGIESNEKKTSKFNKVTRYTTRKFELLPESTEENSPKNLLFGEGEFIFGDKLYIFIMADLYVIGANLYASENKPSDMSYNVYIGKSSQGKKQIKFKLGELMRSQDGKYKLEINSTSSEFNTMVADNNYIQIRLEDKQKTLDLVVLESMY